MVKKRQELQEELQRIEHRCLRARGPGTKENDPDHHEGEDQKDVDMVNKDEKKKRDKFAADADEKEDSDGDDRHEEDSKVEQPEAQEPMGKYNIFKHQSFNTSKIFLN